MVKYIEDISFDDTVHRILLFPISFLLVFRSNTAYGARALSTIIEHTATATAFPCPVPRDAPYLWKGVVQAREEGREWCKQGRRGGSGASKGAERRRETVTEGGRGEGKGYRPFPDTSVSTTLNTTATVLNADCWQCGSGKGEVTLAHSISRYGN